MPADPDETAPQPAVPAEPTTVPAVPVALAAAETLRCFACSGNGKRLTVLARHPSGGAAKAVVGACPTCRGAGWVSRAAWRGFHATRSGRPE